MADRYRAYDPASYYGRDPQAGYHMYDPRGTSLPHNYPSHAPVVPGDYIPRAPIPPREYATRPPSPPDDYISRAHSRVYGLNGPAGVANIPGLPGMSGLPAGARAPGPSPLEDSPLAPLEDPALTRRSTSLGKSAGVPDVEHHSPFLDLDGPSGYESNILFVDGLPSDCTRREVAHLFRPFVGFKDIRVVHKEPRRSGDKGYVLCFVEFEDAKYAFAAMEALQAYRFDDRKPDDPVLKIHFARFPFCMPGAEADKKRAVIRR